VAADHPARGSPATLFYLFLSPNELGLMIDSFIIAEAQRCAGSAGIFEQVAAVSCEMPRSAVSNAPAVARGR
jgi:hypothetical protein